MKPKLSGDPAALRRAAEARLNEKPAARQPRAEADVRRLQHELEVHQIELELQNEELQQSQQALETSLKEYIDLYDFAPTGYLTLTSDSTILSANLTAARVVAIERAHLLGRRCALLISETDRPVFHAFLETTFSGQDRNSCEVTLLGTESAPRMMRFEAVVSADRQECRAAMLDISDRHQTEVDRDLLIDDLRQSLNQVKQLSGLLPICSGCKKIRDDRGYWSAVESYVASHSEATFTHGLCPACSRKYFPDADP